MNTITVAGGNLFQLAAQYLGDATQWLRIAQLNPTPTQPNGLLDPMLTGLNTLVIPDTDQNAGGGIAAQ